MSMFINKIYRIEDVVSTEKYDLIGTIMMKKGVLNFRV